MPEDREPLGAGEFRREVERAGVADSTLTTVIDSLRNEFTAGLTTAGVQIGAVEKSLSEKIDSKFGSLRFWGVLALIGGQSGAAIVTRWIGPAQVAHAALRLLPY